MKADIFLHTYIKNNEGDDEGDFFTVGEYIADDDGYIIKYDENEDLGFENCSVSITVKPNFIVIERSGEASSVLYIDKNHKHQCVYGTPYGDVTLGVNAFEIDNKLGENGGTVSARYGLDLNNDFISENKIHITVNKTEE